MNFSFLYFKYFSFFTNIFLFLLFFLNIFWGFYHFYLLFQNWINLKKIKNDPLYEWLENYYYDYNHMESVPYSEKEILNMIEELKIIISRKKDEKI